MAELLDLFVAELPDRARCLAEAAERGDAERVGHLAHQLKGAGAGYGFPSISTTAGRIEHLVRAVEAPGSEIRAEIRAEIEQLRRLAERAHASRAA